MPRHLLLLLPFFVLLAACGDPRAPRPAEQALDERLADAHAHDAPDPAHAGLGEPEADLEVQHPAYARLEATDVIGYLVRPRGPSEERPAVIMIHEWWGLNDNVRVMARRLAAEGYTVLAVDLYEGRAAVDPAEAQRLLGEAMQQSGRLEQNLRQALRFLVDQEGATRVGVLGWCFGGMWALRTGLLLPDDLDAVVMYYGNPVLERERLAALRAPLLGLFGGADTAVPLSDVRAFEEALAGLGKTAEIVVYEGQQHAFANPSGRAFDEAAAEDAWQRTTAFLAQHLGPAAARP